MDEKYEGIVKEPILVAKSSFTGSNIAKYSGLNQVLLAITLASNGGINRI